jgi:hypothetical protein
VITSLKLKRWKSMHTAARRAERAAREEEAKRNEARRMWCLIAVIFLSSVALVVAEYLWMRHDAQLRHEKSRIHRSGTEGSTNSHVRQR